jgi:hypothetical protein
MRHAEKTINGKFMPPTVTVDITGEDSVLVASLGQEVWLSFDEFLALRWAVGEHADFITHLFNNCDVEEILEAFDSVVQEEE